MPRITDEEHLDRKERRRLIHDAKAEAAISRREDAAHAMVGELCREGRTVCYVHPQGGRYREGTRSDLVAFLIRNRYA